MFRIKKVTLLIGFMIALFNGPVADGSERADDDEIQSWLAIVDFIMENHIDPPARQQMILSGVKALYGADASVPVDLSKQVSSLTQDDEFLELLVQTRRELRSQEGAFRKERFINGVSECVPGGISIMAAEESRIEAQLAANRYVGVGIALTMSDARPQISKSFYHGPGYREGVRDGDVILEVDGASTEKKELSQIVTELRGAEGTDVVLLLQQAGQEPRELRITRGVTFIPTVEGRREVAPGQWTYTDDAHPNIAVLHVRRIGPSTVHEITKIEAELRNMDLSGVVLDLRQAGGSLHDIVMLADKLLDEGTIGFLKTRTDVVPHQSLAGSLFREVPMAVLIAENSGAGEVYLTAALQDSGRAVVVGQPTRSETYVRSRIALPSGDQVELATGFLQRGDGTMLMPPRRPALRSRLNEDSAIAQKPGFIVPDYPLPSSSDHPWASSDHTDIAQGDPWIALAIDVLDNLKQAAEGKRDAEAS